MVSNPPPNGGILRLKSGDDFKDFCDFHRETWSHASRIFLYTNPLPCWLNVPQESPKLQMNERAKLWRVVEPPQFSG